jgi:HEAT repeat protein
VRAVQKLAARTDVAATSGLVAALRDKSPYVAQLAAEALCERADREIAEALLPVFDDLQLAGVSRDPGCYIRASMAHAFGRVEYHPAAESMRSGAHTIQIEVVGGERIDLGAQLRAACALTLAELRDPEALRHITPLLFDTGANRIDSNPTVVPLNPELRAVAARAIGRLGDINGLAVLAVKLQFPEWEREADVLAESMKAALTLAKDEALPLVAPYITYDHRGLGPAAALAIIQSGVESGYSLVKTAITTGDPTEVKAIALTLAAQRSFAAVSLLYEMGTASRDIERLAFAEAVAIMGDKGSIPILEVLAAGDLSKRVKEAARAALVQIAG